MKINKDIKIEDIDVVILCGGKGERLQSMVNDRPKVLAEINGEPFLDILIDYVAGFGFRRFILCIGYMGNMIRQRYRKGNISLTILFSEEKELLGTAGAIKKAQPLIKSNPFLVMNGDSFCQVNLNEFIDFHIIKKASFSISLVKAKRSDDCGVVNLSPSGQVIRFIEKARTRRNGLINAGAYLFESGIFSLIPVNKNFSLEYDLFPKVVNRRFYGFVTEETLIDIGTPERYREAIQIL